MSIGGEIEEREIGGATSAQGPSSKEGRVEKTEYKTN